MSKLPGVKLLPSLRSAHYCNASRMATARTRTMCRCVFQRGALPRKMGDLTVFKSDPTMYYECLDAALGLLVSRTVELMPSLCHLSMQHPLAKRVLTPDV
jgi:hypothetical protein